MYVWAIWVNVGRFFFTFYSYNFRYNEQEKFHSFSERKLLEISERETIMNEIVIDFRELEFKFVNIICLFVGIQQKKTPQTRKKSMLNACVHTSMVDQKKISGESLLKINS